MDNTSTEGCIRLFGKYNQEALYQLRHAYSFLDDLIQIYEVELFGEEVSTSDFYYKEKRENARDLAISNHPDMKHHLEKITLY